MSAIQTGRTSSRVCVGFLHESKRHGRGGIDDASPSLLSVSARLRTGVINAASTSFLEETSWNCVKFLFTPSLQSFNVRL